MTTAELTRPKAKAKRLWTYAEMVAELPETNLPVELWNGEIIMSPAPHPDHQLMVGSFYKILDEYIERQKLGQVFVSPVDVVLTPPRALYNRIQDAYRYCEEITLMAHQTWPWK